MTSYGKRLMVSNIVRNGSLWNYIVFEKEEIFHKFDFANSDLEFEVSKSTILTHTTSCEYFFFFIIISQLRRPLSSNFHRFVILCICWDTWSEQTGLWQLPIVSSVFKRDWTCTPFGLAQSVVYREACRLCCLFSYY